jgi:hypothetical protein
VLVTDALGKALADRVAVSVSTPVGNSPMFGVQASTLAVLEALLLAVSAHDRDSALASMSEMDLLRARLRGEPDAGRQPRRRRSSGVPKHNPDAPE